MSREEIKVITLPQDRRGPPAPKPFAEPPNNAEYEQSALGAVLVRPEVMGKVANGSIYQAMVGLYGRGEPE